MTANEKFIKEDIFYIKIIAFSNVLYITELQYFITQRLDFTLILQVSIPYHSFNT